MPSKRALTLVGPLLDKLFGLHAQPPQVEAVAALLDREIAAAEERGFRAGFMSGYKRCGEPIVAAECDVEDAVDEWRKEQA